MKGAVFTISKNEAVFLPIWLKHYSRYFGEEDIFVLDNGTTDESIKSLSGFTRVDRYSRHAFDVQFLLEMVSQFQRTLLNWGYDFVLFAEADEIVVPEGSFESHLAGKGAVRCLGMEVLHLPGEPVIDWRLPLLRQRSSWARLPEANFDKPLLSTIPLTWEHGFHFCTEPLEIDQNLPLIHLRRIDREACKRRLSDRRSWPRPEDQAPNKAWQWALSDRDFDAWFQAVDHLAQPIPEKYKDAI